MLLIATSNPHKVEEIRETFAALAEPVRIECVDLKSRGLRIPEPVEDEDTFEGNAVLKARYYALASGLLTLADDSGLEVDALDGDPGVRSARYAGIQGPRHIVDPANNQLLMQRLEQVPVAKRTARFVCAMALFDPAASEPIAVVRGTVEGRILTYEEAGRDVKGRGTNGFGYDPLFYISRLKKTTAELSPADKNAVSHRGEATRKMAEWLRKRI